MEASSAGEQLARDTSPGDGINVLFSQVQQLGFFILEPLMPKKTHFTT